MAQVVTPEIRHATSPLFQSSSAEVNSSFQLQLLNAAITTASGKGASHKLQVQSQAHVMLRAFPASQLVFAEFGMCHSTAADALHWAPYLLPHLQEAFLRFCICKALHLAL